MYSNEEMLIASLLGWDRVEKSDIDIVGIDPDGNQSAIPRPSSNYDDCVALIGTLTANGMVLSCSRNESGWLSLFADMGTMAQYYGEAPTFMESVTVAAATALKALKEELNEDN